MHRTRHLKVLKGKLSDDYFDKDKFVTAAYKRKLAEQEKWMEEERLRELREEKEDNIPLEKHTSQIPSAMKLLCLASSLKSWTIALVTSWWKKSQTIPLFSTIL
uniref:Nuclear speckle splicing regulatory protein 1 N-terminal domain-containing protein n=1 Tax=Salix viminalis TaxID=40686 RepID=A0A6N2M6W3_SALVM